MQVLVTHCQAWVARFTGLLHSLASRELGGLQETMRATAVELYAEPGDLRQLAEAVALHRRLAEELPTVAARLPPLKDMYAALDRYGVSPPLPPPQGLRMQRKRKG